MDIFTIGFWIVGAVLFIISIFKNKEKSKEAMKKSKGMMKNMIGDIIGIIFMIGLILTFIPPETIEKVLGSGNTLLSSLVAAIVGSITLIPAFVAFPLVGSFVDAGASIVPGVAFLTTLTMVGVVTFPLEKKEFGTKFAVIRNLLSFGAAISIAILMGVIL
ncbi:Predicted permease [Dethiosulfatibacter aminovorans DSM 17477]|uniref:Predicted permease n=1 Tax=Dethiosulfatibacter aminovorans DSM 17477 TaxID=1121476 RepID=A0A1M6MH73_9FIRM|nr:permease [Dethiosulfatibacter aminovorans]SHJ82797.1 Predicted permease [Dethiosulfatibacter aminovorans DSM 17477]